MKVSEKWLRTLIDPPISTRELVEQLTQAALEVDNLEIVGGESSDTVFTLKTPANRGDCLCMMGVAREISALNQMPYQHVTKTQANGLPNIKKEPEIKHLAKEACPRYLARIIQNMNVKNTSPFWLIDRLQKAGIRSHSPIVDVTNYVMLELGQPLHAFDLDKLVFPLSIRFAKSGEKIRTLDDVELCLEENILVIADNKNPQAIAGIIGSNASRVDLNTTNILLESAYFDPIHIRSTAKHLGVRTESSIRFERGVDPYLQMRAIERATELLTEIMGGNIGPIVEHSFDTAIPKPARILLRRKRIMEILGVDLNPLEVQKILTTLEMKVISDPIQFHETSKVAGMSEQWQVEVPSFRVDIILEEDLIEEIARIYGYHRFPSHIPVLPLAFGASQKQEISSQRMKELLVDRGYVEAINYSFVKPEWLALFTPEITPLILSNPISTEMAAMRTTMIPGLLQSLLYNQNRQQERVRLFEMGRCFLPEGNKYQERDMLAGITSGALYQEQWDIKTKSSDYFDMKSDIEALFRLSGNNDVHFSPSKKQFLHPSKSADVFIEDIFLGYVGFLHPKFLQIFHLQNEVMIFELARNPLLIKKTKKFQDISRFPKIRRDIAIVVPKNVLASDLKQTIAETASDLLQEIIIFDVYQGKGIDSGSKSIALGLILQHHERTLIEAEINELMIKVLQALKNQYQATLRE